MNNEEWHQWRRQGIGSSDATTIMGASPWRTPYELWQEKVFGNSEQLDNSSMMRGRELEPVARTWFEQTMGVAVFPKNKIHPNKQWIRASLDGMDIDDRLLVEIKCPNKEDHFVAINKMIPEKYIPQVQHQLLVTGLDGMYYCSFDGQNGAIVEVARDNAYIEAMLNEEQKFWDMVLAKTPPPLTERDFVSMENDHQWKQISAGWLENKKILDEAENRDKHLKQLLIELSEEHNAEGHGMKISKSLCQGNIDYKQIMADYPAIDWESYRKKPFTKWNFRATG
jgi:putative phage-type endonuclease